MTPPLPHPQTYTPNRFQAPVGFGVNKGSEHLWGGMIHKDTSPSAARLHISTHRTTPVKSKCLVWANCCITHLKQVVLSLRPCRAEWICHSNGTRASFLYFSPFLSLFISRQRLSSLADVPSPSLPLPLQVEWSWASTQADRGSNTGLSVSRTKGRKWSTGIRSHNREPRAVTNRTRLHKTFVHTQIHMHTHIHTHTFV